MKPKGHPNADDFEKAFIKQPKPPAKPKGGK